MDDISRKTALNAKTRLEIESVTVGYSSGRKAAVIAARDISLSIAAGEFAAIIGPSGCGKSTLLNAIAGLVEPSAGRIFIDGNVGAARLGHVAYMQQRDLLLPWRTVLENARLALEINGTDRRKANEAASALAERFGLSKVLDRYPWQLSGGMRQRAALLRSSLQQSGILLLDEPFGALDALTRRDLQQWLAYVLDRRDRAVLLVTHDVEEALLLADRVYVMSPGPGAIAAKVEIALPRPRGEEIVTSPEFVALKASLLHELSAATHAQATLAGGSI
jgi:ABC-type nitrate/sulfonate/bicarbonate transport system ATPase subunit